MSHSVLYRVMNSAMSRYASARFWKRWRYRHCSLRVRMKRSMTPLHSGSSASPLFVDEVLGELQPHHQFADLRAGQGQLPFLGITPRLQPSGPLFEEDALQDRKSVV